MKIDQIGIDLIKGFESCRLEAYQDSVGVWTIGYGCTGPHIIEGTIWTQDQADNELSLRTNMISGIVDGYVKSPVNQNQFDALCSLTYNIGSGAIHSSTLLKLVNEGAFTDAALEFPKWDHAGGKELPGLYTRRLAEQKIFNTPVGEDIT